jgi:YD repeat-containing protein
VFSGTVGTFTDADPGGTTTDYTAIIDWGDGSVPSPGSVLPQSGGGFSVQGNHIYPATGNYTVGITVSDGGGASATAAPVATVATPVTSAMINGLTVTEGQLFNGTVGMFFPGSPNPGAGAFTVTISWGDGNESPGQLTPSGGSYLITGSHTYSDETPPGAPKQLEVTIRNTSNPAASPVTGNATVTVNDAPLTPTGLSINRWTNAPTGNMVFGTFTDANPLASLADFIPPTINWGDNSGTTTGTVQMASGAVFQVVGGHTYAAGGTYTITSSVTDVGGQSTTITSTITITAPTVGLTAMEYTPFSGTVATLSSGFSQAQTATINWGDNTSTPGTIVPGTGGAFSVTGNHTYADELSSPLQLSVTVQMSQGGPITVNGPATVVDAALTSPVGANFTGTVGQPLATGNNQVVVATFNDANPQSSLADFTATINWGDGTASTGTVQTLSGGGYEVLSNHTYDQAGVYTITTTPLDDGGSTLTITGAATISMTEGQDYSLDLQMNAPSSSSDTAGTDYTASVNWGDGTTSTGTVNVLANYGRSYELQITADHTYFEEGSHTATATVTDPAGLQSQASVTVPVVDAALDSAGETVSGMAGSVTTGTIAILNDANTYATAQDFYTGDYTVSISNWGDGASGSGTLQALSGGDFDVLGSHTYAAAGTYTIHGTVTDEGGKSTSFTGTALVYIPWEIIGSPGQRSNDPDRAFLLPIGEATVDLNQGALRLSHALDFDQSPGTSVGGNPALDYSSSTVSVRPVIQIAIQSQPGGSVPTQAQVQLTWNSAQTPVTFNTSGLPAGAVYDLAAQVANPVTTSGVYNWSATVTLTFPNSGQLQLNTSGVAYVLARDASPYGAGWWLDGVSQLVIGPTGALLTTGAGDSRFFALSGSTYLSPAEDFGTLVKNSDGSFTYTAKDRTQTNFNSSGQLSSIVDTHGLARTYSYDTSGRLSQVTAIDGGVTTFTYNSTSGLLQSINEPGGRVVQLQHDGNGNLTQITDVDNTTRTIGYDSGHRATSDQWAPLSATFGYDPNTGLLNSVNRGLGTNYTIVSETAAGLGSAGTGVTYATVTDALTHTTQYLLDSRGRLLIQVLPLGETTVNVRDGAGQVIINVDPLGEITEYSYSYGAGDGDLVSVTNANGAVTQYQYDPTFHHLTETIDPDSVVTSLNSYDPSTGDLLTSQDAMGNTTTYVWSSGLLQSVTDPRGFTSSYVYDSDRRQIVAFDNMGVPTFTGYDADGNVASSTDVLGRTTYTVYSGRNLLLQTVDAEGGTTTDNYNAYGQLTSETDPRRFTKSNVYDQRGFLTSATDNLGNPTQSVYDVAGNLIETLDALNNPTSYGYDADNRRTSVTDALGDTSTTQYDADGNVLSTTDALLRTTTNVYDVLNRLIKTTDPKGRTTQTGYDTAGDVIRTTDPEGLNRWTYYDLDRRVVATVDGRGIANYSFYDKGGNVVETVDGLGLASFNTFDALNRLIFTVDPQGLTTATGYNVVGDAVVTVDARGKTTQYVFDALHRVVETIDVNNNTTKEILDLNGNPIETLDGNNHPSFASFDGDNREFATKDANGNTTSQTRDAVGDVTSTTDQNKKTTYNYFDADERQVLSLDPDFHLTGESYNAVSDVTSQTDGAGDTVQDAYDGDDEETGQRDANGAVSQTIYTPDGQTAAIIDADGNITSYSYDGSGNLIATMDPLGFVTVRTYDTDNRLTSTLDRLGRKKTFAYDNDGRLLSETWFNANGSTADVLSYSYDQDGNLLTAGNSFGTYQFAYDSAGRRLTQTDPFNLTLTYGYDHADQLTSVSDSLGGVLTNVYDPTGQLTSRQFGGTGQIPLRFDIGYTSAGQIATQTRYKDLTGTQKVGFSQFTYDAAGNVLHIQHQNGTGAVLQDFQYSYDTDNRLSQGTDNGTTTNYSYDKDSQLTQAGSKTVTFDANGNRNMSGYVVDSANRLGSDGTWFFEYDAEGNLTYKWNITTHETWTYGYDLNNHMTSAVHQDSSGNTLVSVVIRYDVFGNRVEEDVTQSGTTTVSRYAFDGSNQWATWTARITCSCGT